MRNDRSILDHDRAFSDRKLPSMNGVISNIGVRDRLLGAIGREFRPLRCAAEMLARAAGRTPRAAKNWLSGTNAPDAEALIELMASCNTIADEVNALVEERRKAREQCPGSKSGSAHSSG
ncbi:hypothetical protein [Komagataeibacter europaeus]|uniref:hypothetical protein n=1 Tax=Komagataeibacter europaeus TaxID=33995 RepID=UPI0012DFE2AD|nr:hypothetical protein [Komagataeibacter europaeus]